MNYLKIEVQETDFSVSEEIARLREGQPGIGAVASFVGVVRDLNDDRSVSTMHLEHYAGMTEKAIEGIVDEHKPENFCTGMLVTGLNPICLMIDPSKVIEIKP